MASVRRALPPAPPLRVLEAGRRSTAPRLFRSSLVLGALLWLVLAAIAAGLFELFELVEPAIAHGSSSRLTRSTIAFWDSVAQCETGSHWRGLGPIYQGGLGIFAPNWDRWAGELGLDARYPDAGDAPRLVQIRVADYGRRVHRGYWGCL